MRLALVVFLAAIALGACSSEENANRVVGELASDRIELTAESPEPIIEIAIAEGQAVTAGQLLLRQNADRATARQAEAEAVLAQAQARLDELVRGPRSEKITAARAKVDGAVTELKFRRSEYVRIQEIHAKNLASDEVLDRTRAARDAATSSLDLGRAELEELLSGTTVEELAQAEQAVKQAESRRVYARVDLDRHEIRAPVDGIVDSRLYELGERPVQGQPVVIILPGTQPHARVYLPEHLRVQVAPGTNAQIYIDGRDTPVAGRVRWVASEAAFTPYFALTERDRGRLSFMAKVDIVDELERLPDGVPVEVEFAVQVNDP